jgi:hypothetical protein
MAGSASKSAISYLDARRSGGRTAMSAADTETPPVLDLQQIDRLLGAIYEGPTETPPWQSALQILREELRAAHVTLMLRPPSQDSTGIMINTGPVTRQGVESYETHFFSLDPFVRLPEGQVVTAEELIGRQWLQSAVYQESRCGHLHARRHRMPPARHPLAQRRSILRSRQGAVPLPAAASEALDPAARAPRLS